MNVQNNSIDVFLEDLDEKQSEQELSEILFASPVENKQQPIVKNHTKNLSDEWLIKIHEIFHAVVYNAAVEVHNNVKSFKFTTHPDVCTKIRTNQASNQSNSDDVSPVSVHEFLSKKVIEEYYAETLGFANIFVLNNENISYNDMTIDKAIVMLENSSFNNIKSMVLKNFEKCVKENLPKNMDETATDIYVKEILAENMLERNILRSLDWKKFKIVNKKLRCPCKTSENDTFDMSPENFSKNLEEKFDKVLKPEFKNLPEVVKLKDFFKKEYSNTNIFLNDSSVSMESLIKYCMKIKKLHEEDFFSTGIDSAYVNFVAIDMEKYLTKEENYRDKYLLSKWLKDFCNGESENKKDFAKTLDNEFYIPQYSLNYGIIGQNNTERITLAELLQNAFVAVFVKSQQVVDAEFCEKINWDNDFVKDLYMEEFLIFSYSCIYAIINIHLNPLKNNSLTSNKIAIHFKDTKWRFENKLMNFNEQILGTTSVLKDFFDVFTIMNTMGEFMIDNKTTMKSIEKRAVKNTTKNKKKR